MDSIENFLESRTAEEFYFVAISLILAFGILQTTGEVFQTDRPVVSVTSCSMYPALNVGDILVVDGSSFDSIEEGDVVVYDAEMAEVEINGERRLMAAFNSSKSIEAGDSTVSLEGIGSARRDTNGDGSLEQVKFAAFQVDGRTVRIASGGSRSFDGVRIGVRRVGSNIPVVHRVVRKSDDAVETRGDNNRGQIWFEKSVSSEQVHGNVVFVVPRVGGLKLLAMDLVGFNGDRPLVLDSFPSCERRT